MGLTEFAFSLFIFPILIFIAVFIFERAFGTRLIRLGCTCWEQVPWRESRESRISSTVAPEPSALARYVYRYCYMLPYENSYQMFI